MPKPYSMEEARKVIIAEVEKQVKKKFDKMMKDKYDSAIGFAYETVQNKMDYIETESFIKDVVNRLKALQLK